MGSRLSLLSNSQRRLLGLVLLGGGFLLGGSAYLALAAHGLGIGDAPHHLPLTYQVMLVAHFVVGLLVFLPTIAFAVWHLRRALLRKTRFAVPTGLGVILVSLFLFVSGFFILTAANSRENLWAFAGHQIAAVLLPALYAIHRCVSKDPPERRSAWRGAGFMAAVVAIALLAHGLESLARRNDAPARTPPRTPADIPEAWAGLGIADPFVPFEPTGYVNPASPFFPSATTTTTRKFLPARIIHHDDFPDRAGFEKETREKGFAPSHYLGAQSCVRCHQDIVDQWAQSAHRFASFNNPFYRKSVELTRETRGKKTSQWCGGCHDPAIMLAGNMTEEIDPLTPESQAGLTCLACHAIDRIHDQTGNGAYNIQDEVPSPYVFDTAKGALAEAIHDYVLKAKPTVHKREMLKPVFRTAEFCSACHKVNLDEPVNGYRWFRGQNEYDAWHNSGIPHHQPMTWYEPADKKVCQDCHMPPEDAPRGDVAAKGGKVRSHRFIAVNTALPHLRGDQDMLRRIEEFLRDAKLRLDVFALHAADGRLFTAIDQAPPVVRPGTWIQVDLIVRNVGVGHTFPGGTNDSNEGWIDFEASANDRTIWRSGAIAKDGHVDPAAHFYQAVFVDKTSTRISRRNPADIHSLVYANVIPPSGSDIVRYRFRIPEDQPDGELTLHADLNWRKFNRTFTEFVFEGKPVPDLPVTRIVSAAARVRVSKNGPESPPAPPIAADWIRHNDYGIGLFLDGDTKGALAAFATVAHLVPEKPDGWRNQARAYLADGQLEKAEEMLRKASDAAPDEARTAFFWGQLLQESGRLDEAIQAFERTLQVYPESRDAWSLLGKTHWQKGDALASLRAYGQVLRIDPEDALAHHQRSLAYKSLAAKAADEGTRLAWAYAAAEAEKAFEKYKLDEDAAAVTLKYRMAHPHDNLMSQRIVIHEQNKP